MKKLLLTLCFLFVCTASFGAEFLIQAKPHWKDAWKTNEVNKLTPEEKKSYDSRIEIGDIVVIKPNGWEWGREETLPNYYIVKVPNISVEEAEHLTQSLMDTTDPENPVMLKKRRYKIPQTIVNQLNANNGVMTYNVSAEVIANIIDKLQ